MSLRDRIDPESREPLDALLQAIPGGFNAISDIAIRRQTVTGIVAAMAADIPPNPNVTKTDHVAPGPEGSPDVPVRVYRPTAASGNLSGLFVIHGGGMVLGNIDGEDQTAIMLAETLGIVVVSTDYRKAPENPHPAQVNDCYAALLWTAAHADELGIDATKLAIFGGSAGGNLCIATSMTARDKGGPALCLMMAPYPMIDDTNTTPSSQEITDIGFWDRSANLEAWSWFLGGQPADQYAAPARATDLSGLPPAFIDVGTLDVFRDEDITFVQRLIQAGVPTEFHVYPGAYHASEVLAPTAALSQRIWATRIAALQRALA